MKHPLDARIAELERELRELTRQRSYDNRSAGQTKRFAEGRHRVAAVAVTVKGAAAIPRDPLEAALFGRRK